MRHTKLLSTAVGVLLAVCSIAQTRSKLNLEHATVFLSGALLESTATLNLKQGESEIIFSNVATNVNSQSIIINATNGVAVASTSVRNIAISTNSSAPAIAKMEDSISLAEQSKLPLTIKISVIDDQLKLLQTDITDNGDDKPAPGAGELEKMIDLISKKKETLLLQKAKLTVALSKIDERIERYNARITDEANKNKLPGGELIVKFFAREATSSKITIKYIVTTAGWSPAYDIWANDVKSPLKLYYKANIYQNSGIKWDDVRLTLSTGNPQEGMQPPVINTWSLSLYAPPQSTLKEIVIAYKKPLIDRYKNNIILTGEEIKSKPTTATSDLVALSGGTYQSKRGANMSSDGGRGTGNLYVVDGVASMTNYVAVDNSGVNTTFDIELPYTIPSDGQQHYVSVKEYDVPADYQYFAIPKLDKDAFLQAEIGNWNELNLLPGPTNIFYEGTYIGQGNIDPRNILDTMFLSLGRDKKIVIKREQDKKLHSIKKTGSNEQESYAYNTTIRNNRKEPITVLVQDQLPVSNDKALIIEDVEMGGAEYDQATGTLTWTVKLKASEAKKLSFSYTIKHPKERQVIGMR